MEGETPMLCVLSIVRLGAIPGGDLPACRSRGEGDDVLSVELIAMRPGLFAALAKSNKAFSISSCVSSIPCVARA